MAETDNNSVVETHIELDKQYIYEILKNHLGNAFNMDGYDIVITKNIAHDGAISNYSILISNDVTKQYCGFVLPYNVDDYYSEESFEEDMFCKVSFNIQKMAEMNSYNEVKNSKYTSLSVGSVFNFGNFEGKTLTWRVIMKRGSHLLVIADDIIRFGAFHYDKSTNKWENCSLRKWLNEEFYKEAFSEGEKCFIEKRNIVTSSNKRIQDKVFLLNEQEVYKWLPDKSDREASSWWWLRDSAHYMYEAQSVYTGASFYGVFGTIVSYQGGGIRPSLWLKVK